MTAAFQRTSVTWASRFEIWLRCLLNLTLVVTAALCPTLVAQGQDDIRGSEATFKFIANQLQRFQRTGQMDPIPGLDGSGHEDFLDLLRSVYVSFTQGIGTDSAMCRIYLDPENGRMELEERAVLAVSFLPPLVYRLQRFREIDLQFQQTVTDSYGGALLATIETQKFQVGSYEYLPTWEFNAAEAVHFADTACGG